VGDHNKLNRLDVLIERLALSEIDRRLLSQALTHSSYGNEVQVEHNERLEFLGDAVLELLTSQYLYGHYPDLPEGELTRMRANLVCEKTLAEIARELGLGGLLLLGKSQLATGGRERASLLADAVEALLGAVYLCGGLAVAEAVYHRLFREAFAALDRGELWQDYKTRLQEMVQKQLAGDALTYQVTDEAGPDHDKTFSVAVSWQGRVVGQGTGHSKKEAEQAAAKQALHHPSVKGNGR
jgi:ribonuclease-3